MNVLLVNPSLRRARIGHYGKGLEKNRGIYPSIGLAYVAGALERCGHRVIIVDCDTVEDPEAVVEDCLARRRPQMLGIHTMTWTYRQAAGIARKAKAFDPGITTVAGGPNVSSFPVFPVEAGDFDCAVLGEGEETAKELAEAIEGRRDMASVRGLIYRSGGDVAVNPPRPLCEHLDSLGNPARHLLPLAKYYDVFARQSRFATMIATRGCPWDCTFCDRKNRMGRKWRARSPQHIVAEMKDVYTRHGIREFMFFDDNFVIDREWVLTLCEELQRTGVDLCWEIRARVDMVDLPLLKAMRRAGCYRIRYGMESGDNAVLKTLKKGITVEQSRDCARMTREAGIEVFAYFMLGSPGETRQSLDKTIDLALAIDPDYALFSKTILIVGSELFEWAVRNGLIRADYWERFLGGEEENPAPALSTAELPEEVVSEYVSKANKRFYGRPSYVLRRLGRIRHLTQLGRQLRMAAGILRS